MTVQEWVAALPPLESHSDEDHSEDQQGDTDEDEDKHEPSDHIRLGEEASYFVPNGVKNFGQLLLQKNNKNIRFRKTKEDIIPENIFIWIKYFQILSSAF